MERGLATRLLTWGCFTDDPWPELLSALFQLSQAAEPEKRACAFRVFTTTPAVIENQHETMVLEAFQKGFTDDAVLVRTIWLLLRRKHV